MELSEFVDHTPLFVGYSVRECLEGGVWADINKAGCVSPEGQQWEFLAESLEGGLLLAQEEANFTTSELMQFVTGMELTGGDLQAGWSLLNSLIQVQRVGGAEYDTDVLKVSLYEDSDR